jgi:hypothetical protein
MSSQTVILKCHPNCHPERCASSYALASKNDSGSHTYMPQQKKRKPEQIKLPFYHFTKNYLQITQKIMQQAKHIFSHYKVESTELK